MHENSYPTEVTVIVYSVKNIKPKKKDLKYCVIFSIGSAKYRTDLTDDVTGNPVFNTESTLQVDDHKHPLTLVATEKKEKEFYGQLVIPLESLGRQKSGRIIQVPLGPHKKCPKPTAEIHFEAWVSRVMVGVGPMVNLMAEEESGKIKKGHFSGLKKTLAALAGPPKVLRKSSKHSADLGVRSLATLGNSKQISSSCFDISSPMAFGTLPAGRTNSLANVHEIPRSIREESPEPTPTVSKLPEISGISPNSGPVSGGTKITIRGTNLGTCKEDVVGLFVCGSNVLASLEYSSSSKVVCTAKAWRPCEGVITMETQSGGKASSSVKFSFVSEDVTITVTSCDPDQSASVRRAESLNNGQKPTKFLEKSGLSGSPKLSHKSIFNGKLFSNPMGFPASRSMLDLSGQGQVQGHQVEDWKSVGGSAKSSFLSPLVANSHKGSNTSINTGGAAAPGNLPGCNSSKNVGVTTEGRSPPVIHIQPMRFQQPDTKAPSKQSASLYDLVYQKGLEMQLGNYKTITSELQTKSQKLEEENKRLSGYIETLVAKIMLKCPELLCSDG